MDFRILGPLEVWDGARPLELRRPKQRALLAALLLRAGQVVSVDQLLDDLWGERPPPTARNSLHNAVSALRKLLGAEVVRRQAPGYLLDVERQRVDLFRFEALLEQARSTENEEERAERLRQALTLWRGPPACRPRLRAVRAPRGTPARGSAHDRPPGTDRGPARPG